MPFPEFKGKRTIKESLNSICTNKAPACVITIDGTETAVSVTCNKPEHSGIYPEGEWIPATATSPEMIRDKKATKPVYVIVRTETGISCNPAPEINEVTGSWTADDNPTPPGGE